MKSNDFSRRPPISLLRGSNRIHKDVARNVPQGIKKGGDGYVYARDGEPADQQPNSCRVAVERTTSGNARAAFYGQDTRYKGGPAGQRGVSAPSFAIGV